MGFLNKLLGRDEKPARHQAVIVHFQYGLPDLKPLFALEHRLESAINSAGDRWASLARRRDATS